MQDLLINLDGLTEFSTIKPFILNEKPNRPDNRDKYMVSQIVIEMDLDAILISRVNFTFLDALSDIGGIQSLLSSFFSILLMALNYEHLESYMASRLYKLKKVDGHDRTKYKRHFDRSDFFQPSKLANLLNYIMDKLPARCVCCSKNRKRLGMEQARAALAKEIDIIELIKQRRFF